MTVLTSSPDPTALLTSTSSKALIALLAPALTHSYHLATLFQHLLSTTTLFLFFRAYISALFLLRQSFFASQILLIQSYYASKLLLIKSYYASALLARKLGPVVEVGRKEARRLVKKLSKKLFFEFMVFVLGTGGNQILLVLFWPGWMVLGGVVGGVWWACG
jgi:hypothetical protein